MAAPPPYWKKKTRPCPFYSQGRCLFSDSCNFVHSVKVNHEPPAVRADNTNTFPGGVIFRDGKARVVEGENDVGERTLVDTGNPMKSSPKSLSRSSSGSRRRTVLMSPPRSPRLSGLLSALESVIGPDVVEYEEIYEEDGSEGGEDSLDASEEPAAAAADVRSPASSSLSSRNSTSLPYYQDSPAAPHTQPASPLADPDSHSPTINLDVDTETNTGASAPPRQSSTRPRVPSPIVTQHLDPGESITTVLDTDTDTETDTLEVHASAQQTHYTQHLHQFDDPSRGSRRQSTFELLTSPFASPALRILSQNVGEPISPIFGALQRSSTPNERTYADDDVCSLETLESSTEESQPASSNSSFSHDSEDADYKDDGIDAGNTSDEPAAESWEDLGSPHETERPTSDYFRTPRNPPSRDETVVDEIEDLPPLPPSLTRNSDGTNRRLSQVVFPSSGVGQSARSPPPAISATDIPSEPTPSTSALVASVQHETERPGLDYSRLRTPSGHDEAVLGGNEDSSPLAISATDIPSEPSSSTIVPTSPTRHETERPTSDYSRTPSSHDEAVVEENEDLPPLSPSSTRDNDEADRWHSQVEALSSDAERSSRSPPLTISSADIPSDPSSSTIVPTSPTRHETERPISNYSRTPPSHDEAVVEENEDLPPLSSSSTRDNDEADRRRSQVVLPSAGAERSSRSPSLAISLTDIPNEPSSSARHESDYSYTPGSPAGHNEAVVEENEDLLPLSPSSTRDNDEVDRIRSQVVLPSAGAERSSRSPSLAISSTDVPDEPSPFSSVPISPAQEDVVNLSKPVESREDIGSPPERERPTSDYFRTPRNPLSHDEAVLDEIEDLPPLPPPLTRNSDGAYRRRSQDVLPSASAEDSSHSPSMMISATDIPSEPSSSMTVSTSPAQIKQSALATDDDFNNSPPFNAESSSVLDDLYGDLSASPSRAEETTYETSGEEESISAAIVPAVHVSSIGRLSPIITTRNGRDSLDSLTYSSLGPSPISTDRNSAHTADTMDTLVESDIEERESLHETILERRTKYASGSAKRLEVLSVTSPTKELRESYFPSSLEKTVKPAPSPLYEDSQHSASSSVASSVASSPRPSWADLQKKAGVSQKVPFGFRQSLLVDQETTTSLAEKLASHSAHGSSASRSSSGSSLSPTSASHARPASRVDMLAGRARSISPASLAAGPSSHRHSFSSKSSSVPSLRVRSFANQPRSASQLEFFSNSTRSDSPTHIGGSEPSSSRPASWMKPLRLSRVNSPASSDHQHSPSLSFSKRFSTASILSSKSHTSNASQGSLVDNSLLSSSRSSLLSAYLDDPSIPNHDIPPIISNDGPSTIESVLFSSHLTNASLDGDEAGHRHSYSTGTINDTTSNIDLLSPLSGSMRGLNFEEFSQFHWPGSNADINYGGVSLNENISPKQATTSVPFSHTLIPPPSAKSTPTSARIPIPAPSHAIATPRPTLMFAIASDNPTEVERVLASGEAHPNDIIGPQTALEFALTNDALVNKTEIVKTLLAYGADPNILPEELRSVHNKQIGCDEEEEDILADLPSEAAGASISKRKKRESALNPAMKYYLNRATAGAQAVQTSAALRRSDFRSLARMRFDFVGQDRALEHLYWVLGMHSQQPIGTPLVVLCCGPSGHGKSLLARKFGSLLDVPTHTVNMTILKTSHDLWQCPSMSPYDPPSERTLAEFLEENAGKRCVVVLDEIDKNEDERTLWSLLAPWELGRCSIDAGRRHIDVRNVIWLGTSNIGQDLVFEHHGKRAEPDTIISKAEYRGLMNSLRPLVTERLGTSLMSRVTAVLPFVPFTDEEKLAIASEAVLALGGEMASELEPEEFEKLASQCVAEYVSTDGARSLYRSVSTHLMEAF